MLGALGSEASPSIRAAPTSPMIVLTAVEAGIVEDVRELLHSPQEPLEVIKQVPLQFPYDSSMEALEYTTCGLLTCCRSFDIRGSCL